MKEFKLGTLQERLEEEILIASRIVSGKYEYYPEDMRRMLQLLKDVRERLFEPTTQAERPVPPKNIEISVDM